MNMDGWIIECMNEWMDGCLNEWINEWIVYSITW